jgi:hypothetical protein
MGKVTTPKFSIAAPYVDFVNQCRNYTRQAWDGKHYGKPTVKSIAQWVADFNKSLEVGGANYHLRNGMSNISSAVVAYNCPNGATVAEYSAPMFQVI